MIVDWFLQQLDGATGWFLGLFSGITVPTWFSQLSTLLGQVLAGAAGMGVWIPWAFLGLVATSTLALWGVGFLIKFCRWVLGLIPTMGGG